LHEFHHLLDVGGVVLEMETHIVSKLLHGSGELILLGGLSIALEDMPFISFKVPLKVFVLLVLVRA
jgi:hypothetical protein